MLHTLSLRSGLILGVSFIHGTTAQSSSGSADPGSPNGPVGNWTGGFPVDPIVFTPNGTDYNFTTGSSGDVEGLNITGVPYTGSNTVASDLGITASVASKLFPEVARQALVSTGVDVSESLNSGFTVPAGFSVSSLKNTAYSTADTPVVLEGTPFRSTPGLSSGDYIASPDPIVVPGNNGTTSTSSGPAARLSPTIWYGGYYCSAWQQNVLVTQFGIGALIATCLDSSSVKSEASVAGCIRRMLPRLSAAAGYQASSWNTNCFVCINDAIQSMNLWDPSVKTACDDAASSTCPIDIVSAQFESCSGFNFIEPELASFCDYSYGSADLFQSMVETCIGTAQSGSDMKACVEYTIGKSGFSNMDANCLSSWAYLLEATNKLADKSECQKDVTSSACTSALSRSLSNFATWAGFDPTSFYYAYPADGTTSQNEANASSLPVVTLSFAILLSLVSII